MSWPRRCSSGTVTRSRWRRCLEIGRTSPRTSMQSTRCRRASKCSRSSSDIYEGMRLVLTQNLNKRQDFVNGMTATVEAYHDESGCLQVLTKTGKRLAVPCVRERVEGFDIDYFPIRCGYASTIQKVQGQTLEHVTIWLDRRGCKAAGYVAMSRVKTDADYLIAGPATPSHFVPAM